MKLRTSFFNFAVLRKNLTRFAPLWILYAVAEVLGIMSINVGNPGLVADDLAQIMGPVAIFHAGYAFLVAACLFGDLFDSRLCNGLHAMPMRREGWLLTNLASGLVFALIPAVIGAGVAAIVLKEYFWIGLLWQGTSLLQFVFFFGVAVFSAMCTGKRLGMAAIYGILNFLSMLIFWVVDTVFEPLLPGVVLSDDWFVLFCPVVSMVQDTYADFYWDSNLGGIFKGFVGKDWSYLYICTGVGVVFTVLGWLLYRKRHLETAGDFISFRPMRIFFLLAYTIAMGALMFSFTELFFGLYRDYGFLLAGIVIGWFTGWMLLERTVKVFSKKVFLSFVAFAVFLAGCVGLTKLDPLGVTTYIPKTEDIAKVCLYSQNESFDYEQNDDYAGWYITDQAEIAWVQDLHRQMLMVKGATDQTTFRVNVRYELQNGFHVYRQYDIPAKSETAEKLRPFFSDMRSVFSTGDLSRVKTTLDSVYIWLNGEGESVEIYNLLTQQELIAAIEADCKAGAMAQDNCYHMNQESVGYIDLSWTTVWDDGKAQGTRHEDIVVYGDCVNTRAFLETLEEN